MSADPRLKDWEEARAEASALLAAFDRWEEARAGAEAERVALNAAIRASSLSPAEVARVLGWPRQRVNAVLHS